MGRPFELVIFDCDGVLVDSERVTNLVFAELLGERPSLVHDLALLLLQEALLPGHLGELPVDLRLLAGARLQGALVLKAIAQPVSVDKTTVGEEAPSLNNFAIAVTATGYATPVTTLRATRRANAGRS